jgi:hypothetical protein
MPVAVLGQDGNSAVEGVELGFLALAPCCGVLSVLAD